MHALLWRLSGYEIGLSGACPPEKFHMRADRWGNIGVHCGVQTEKWPLSNYFAGIFGQKQ
jgi:hypothetical protein